MEAPGAVLGGDSLGPGCPALCPGTGHGIGILLGLRLQDHHRTPRAEEQHHSSRTQKQFKDGLQ